MEVDRRPPQGALGLQDHHQINDWKNLIFVGLWIWSHGPHRTWGRILKKRQLRPRAKYDLATTWAWFSQRKVTWLTTSGPTYRRRTARYFNLKVKTRRFKVGNLILKRILHNKGALDPSWEGSYKIAKVLTPGVYQLAHLNRDRIPRSRNTDYLRMYYQWLYASLSIKFTI